MRNIKIEKHALIKLIMFFSLLFTFIGIYPQQTQAHASLIKANPAPQSHLQNSPETITLTFNERLEEELYYIKLFNSKGNNIAHNKAVMSKDQHKLILKLPELQEGIYTVSYHVISADGHPVEASYPVMIGDISKFQSGSPDGSTSSIAHDHGGMSFLLIRAMYYFALLTVIGLLFWFNVLKRKGMNVPFDFSFWFKSMAGLLFLMTIGLNYLDLGQAIGEATWSNLTILLFKTTTGLAAVSLTVLTVLSLFVLRRWLWADILWLVLISFTEALNGHAAAFTPVIYTVLLDTIHLLTAGIWTGGMIYIIIYWASSRDHVWRFLPIFSKGALISFLILVITGSLSAIAFLPTLKDLFISTWGILLLVKILLVILVIVLAAFLRFLIRRNRPAAFQKFHRLDLLFLSGIIIIVGAMTYLSPLPENQPFHSEATSQGIKTDINIQPKNPGTKNVFTVTVSPSQTSVQSVQMFLIYQGNKKLAPIEIPLKKEKKDHGGKKQFYYASGPFIPFSGDYIVQVRILDQQYNENVINKQMTVYPVDFTK